VGSGQAPVRYNHTVLVRFVGRLGTVTGTIFSRNVTDEPVSVHVPVAVWPLATYLLYINKFSFTVGGEDVVKGKCKDMIAAIIRLICVD
jgi:hypothetical protein